MKQIEIGDLVICEHTGVVGIVIKQYYPTAAEHQTMVRTLDGRKYHAPTSMWRKYTPLERATLPVVTSAMAPIIKQDAGTRSICVDGMTFTVDRTAFNKSVERELYKNFDLYRSLEYGG